MKLNDNETIKFYYGVAFNERLLSGEMSYYEGHSFINYDLRYFNNGKLTGKFPLTESLKRKILPICEITSLDDIAEVCEGKWD
ncbi:MAG: hypothetical protein AAF485_27975, partial [Chloroflexota bacterium]